MRANRRRRGFTLVELLTVIAIIALLSAILFPVFSQVRKKGAQTVCVSNLNQLGKAILTYVQDTGGFIPTWCISHSMPTSVSNPNLPGHLTWDASIKPYMQNTEILKCSSNPNPNWKQARAYSIAHYTQKPTDGPPTTGWAHPLRGCYLDEIPAPTRTVVLFEKGAHPPTAWGDALGQNVWETTNHKETEAPPGDGASWSEDMFHFDGKNILYLDGHAKFSQSGQYPFTFKSARSDAITGDIWVAARQSAGGDWPDNE